MTRENVLDTETTGFGYGRGDRIVSIAVVETVDFRRTGNFLHFHVNPGLPSHPGALAVHGLTEAFLAGKPRFDHVVSAVLDFLSTDPIVAHNAPFDRGFLLAELDVLRRRPPLNRWVCTKERAQRIYGGRAGNRLDDLVKRFAIADLRKAAGAHGALIDALLLTQVYAALFGKAVVPLTPGELSLYGVGNGGGKDNQSGAGVPAQPQGEGVSGSAGGGGRGAGQDVCRDAGVHNPATTGRAESAGPTSGAAGEDSFERSGVDGGPGITEEDIWASGVDA